ncbi:lactoylglutathione lyase [Chromatiales bacterium (ex Bugula neritina AB1)]|nr:lactoylglutathione lyase [Chromatiales bacterium (ex Bugula neritina AB1)]
MFAHITVGCSDVARAIAFYDALLNPLGIFRRDADRPEEQISATHICWIPPDSNTPLFFVVVPFDDKAPSAGNGSMVAFNAQSSDEVDRSYQQGIASGGSDEGPPGLRLHYSAGYYGAYLRDPDGNKVHVVFRGDH